MKSSKHPRVPPQVVQRPWIDSSPDPEDEEPPAAIRRRFNEEEQAYQAPRQDALLSCPVPMQDAHATPNTIEALLILVAQQAKMIDDLKDSFKSFQADVTKKMAAMQETSNGAAVTAEDARCTATEALKVASGTQNTVRSGQDDAYVIQKYNPKELKAKVNAAYFETLITPRHPFIINGEKRMFRASTALRAFAQMENDFRAASHDVKLLAAGTIKCFIDDPKFAGVEFTCTLKRKPRLKDITDIPHGFIRDIIASIIESTGKKKADWGDDEKNVNFLAYGEVVRSIQTVLGKRRSRNPDRQINYVPYPYNDANHLLAEFDNLHNEELGDLHDSQ